MKRKQWQREPTWWYKEQCGYAVMRITWLWNWLVVQMRCLACEAWCERRDEDRRCSFCADEQRMWDRAQALASANDCGPVPIVSVQP